MKTAVIHLNNIGNLFVRYFSFPFFVSSSGKSVFYSMTDIFSTRNPFKVGNNIVMLVSVFVIYFRKIVRVFNKSHCYSSVNKRVFMLFVNSQTNNFVSAWVVALSKSFSSSKMLGVNNSIGINFVKTVRSLDCFNHSKRIFVQH